MRLRVPHVWAFPKKPYVIPTVDDSGHPQQVTVTAGQVYVFICDVLTRSNVDYQTGDILVVQDSTTKTPYGEISQSGINWICETRHGTSVWATLEQCIARGLLKLRPETED